MRRGPLTGAVRVGRGIRNAIRATPRLFAAVVAGVLLLNLMLPPLVLSVVRKPWDHFSFNPWIKRVPEWLRSDEATREEKVAFLPRMAIFWFIANGPADEPEWGFSATVTDAARWLATALVFGAYFALWRYRRRHPAAFAPGAAIRAGAPGGFAAAALSTLGFSTLPCSVVGCGAPVMPVMALALTGLSSGALAWLSTVPRMVNLVVMLVVGAAVLYMGWLAGAPGDAGRTDTAMPGVRPA